MVPSSRVTSIASSLLRVRRTATGARRCSAGRGLPRSSSCSSAGGSEAGKDSSARLVHPPLPICVRRPRGRTPPSPRGRPPWRRPAAPCPARLKPASRACTSRRTRPTPPSPTFWSSTSVTSPPASPGRNVPRTGFRSPTPRRPSSRRWRSSTRRRPRRWGTTVSTRRAASPSRPPTRPPRNTTTSAADRARRCAREAVATVERESKDAVDVTLEDGTVVQLDHGRVVIAAITSCTNTSNPSVMIGAGLLARNAVERGLDRRPWVKTSLAPGSTVVTDYLGKAGLTEYLDRLQFNLVGYGCTTCIGNSGPLPPEISAAVEEKDLTVCAVLSGNRNFEGRINQDVKANYLASPPLVVAYALAGRMDLDLTSEPLGEGADGEPVYLCDIWPDPRRGDGAGRQLDRPEMFTATTARSSRAMRPGRRSRFRRATATPGPTRPTCAGPRSSKGCRPSRRGWSRSPGRGCPPCSATRSPPITSHPPARSRRTAPQDAG